MTYSEHVHQYQTSGSSIKVYCAQHNIKYATFLYHHRKQTKKSADEISSFIPISFALSNIEIQYTNGIKLFLSQDTPATFIKSLIQ